MQIKILGCITSDLVTRSRSRSLTISVMEVFAAKVNDWKPFTIVTKNSVVDIAGVWDPSMELDLGTQSLFTAAFASFAFLAAVFQCLKRHKWSSVKYIVSFFWFENGFLQVKPS